MRRRKRSAKSGAKLEFPVSPARVVGQVRQKLETLHEVGDRFDHCGSSQREAPRLVPIAHSLRAKTSHGEVVRKKLGLRPGTVLEFEADGARLIGRKASGRDVVDELFGSMPMDEPVDDYIEHTRGR